MSADKERSLKRRIELLRRAVGCYSWLYTDYRRQFSTIKQVMARRLEEGKPFGGGIYFHCEGGMALDNPDIQRLVEDGHLGPIKRGSPPKKFSSKFLSFFRWTGWGSNPIEKNGGSICGHALRTYRPVTEAGIQFLKENDHKFPYERKWR